MKPEALFAAAYLPPLSYAVAAAGYASVVVEQHENYRKQSWRNRCLIAGPNRVQTLSVPVDKEGRHRVLMKDLRISYAEPWQRLHWRSITTAYNNAPYFLYYRDALETVLLKHYPFLLDLNLELTRLLFSLAGLQVAVRLSEAFAAPGNVRDDFRYSLDPKRPPILPLRKYPQVFAYPKMFPGDFSLIDLLFNLGPETRIYLSSNPLPDQADG